MVMKTHDNTLLDGVLFGVNDILQCVFPSYVSGDRRWSDDGNVELTIAEKSHSAGLMRINHVGEVCAQGLYRGALLEAKTQTVADFMWQSLLEERAHLFWCHCRLVELNSRSSYLTAFWYVGAFSFGWLAAKIGDETSLGFVAETEKQVESHLSGQLEKLPKNDLCSRAIVKQMMLDEAEHADAAQQLGGKKLPELVTMLMSGAAGFMKQVAYWI